MCFQWRIGPSKSAHAPSQRDADADGSEAIPFHSIPVLFRFRFPFLFSIGRNAIIGARKWPARRAIDTHQ